MRKKIDVKKLTGKRYGYLTILEDGGKNNRGAILVLCKCDCGTIKNVLLSLLKNGKTKSCGCLKSKLIRARYDHIKGTPIYTMWENMKTRCYNKNNEKYNCYGGRGIRVCDEWKRNPKAFYDFAISNGWKKGLQIDRIDNDGDYSPENCRFVSRTVNVNNVQRLRRNNTTGYRGVKKRGNKYSVAIRMKGHKPLHQYGFNTAKDAAIFRDDYIIANNINTVLNFPERRLNHAS